MAASNKDEQLRAQRVADTLNSLIGSLHAARSTTVIWGRQVDNPKYKVAAKFGLQIAFGTVVLTLRKFEDLWKHHLTELITDGSSGRADCEWIIDECGRRKLRQTANRLIAHYAADKCDWPLSTQEIKDLILSNGWATEEEVLEWLTPVIGKMISVRDEVMRRYDIQALADEEVKE